MASNQYLNCIVMAKNYIMFRYTGPHYVEVLASDRLSSSRTDIRAYASTTRFRPYTPLLTNDITFDQRPSLIYLAYFELKIHRNVNIYSFLTCILNHSFIAETLTL